MVSALRACQGPGLLTKSGRADDDASNDLADHSGLTQAAEKECEDPRQEDDERCLEDKEHDRAARQSTGESAE